MSTAICRASRPCASLRSASQRSVAIPKRNAQLRIRTQQPMIVRAAEEGGIDTEKLTKDLTAKWEAIENKPQFLLYTAGTFAGVWFTAIVLGAVDKFPLIPKAFELVGLSYSAWFTYRYLLFKSGRIELIEEVEALKEKISGPTE